MLSEFFNSLRFSQAGVELEQVEIMKPHGPVESTLSTINESGLLVAIVQLRSALGPEQVNAIVRPIPFGSEAPYDRLFIESTSAAYIGTLDILQALGFLNQPVGYAQPFHPNYFTENRNQLVLGVQNQNAKILQADFRR